MQPQDTAGQEAAVVLETATSGGESCVCSEAVWLQFGSPLLERVTGLVLPLGTQLSGTSRVSFDAPKLLLESCLPSSQIPRLTGMVIGRVQPLEDWV